MIFPELYPAGGDDYSSDYYMVYVGAQYDAPVRILAGVVNGAVANYTVHNRDGRVVISHYKR